MPRGACLARRWFWLGRISVTDKTEKYKMSAHHIAAVESCLEILKWEDVVKIDKTAAKGERSETIPVKDGVKVVRVRREEVKK